MEVERQLVDADEQPEQVDLDGSDPDEEPTVIAGNVDRCRPPTGPQADAAAVAVGQLTCEHAGCDDPPGHRHEALEAVAA